MSTEICALWLSIVFLFESQNSKKYSSENPHTTQCANFCLILYMAMRKSKKFHRSYSFESFLFFDVFNNEKIIFFWRKQSSWANRFGSHRNTISKSFFAYFWSKSLWTQSRLFLSSKSSRFWMKKGKSCLLLLANVCQVTLLKAPDWVCWSKVSMSGAKVTFPQSFFVCIHSL